MDKWMKRQINENNIFSLNTKTVCFLCLGKQCSTKVECLGATDDGRISIKVEAGEEDLECEKKTSLLSIGSYLKIKSSEIFTSVLGKGTPEEERLFESISGFSVTLCSICGLVVEKLSDKCFQWELVQRIKTEDSVSNGHDVCHVEVDLLRAFNEVLEDSERDQDRLYMFRDELTKPVEMVNGNLAEMLRKEMKENCTREIENVTPAVPLGEESVENVVDMKDVIPLVEDQGSLTNTIPLLSPPVVFHKNLSITVSTPPKISLPVSKTQDAQPSVQTEESLVQSDKQPSSSVKVFRNRTEKNISRKRYRYTCTLCEPERSVITKLKMIHNFSCHPETLFPSSKLDHVSMEDFKAYCDSALDLEVRACAQRENANGKTVLQCPHCRPFSGVAPFNGGDVTMRRHFVSKHHHCLAKKIVQLQNTSTLEILKDKLKSYASKGWWTCVRCGGTFATNPSLENHKKHHCHGDGEKSERKKYVPYYPHGLWQPKRARRIVNLNQVPVIRASCEQCGGLMYNRASLDKHFRFVCVCGPKLNPEMKCELCGKHFQNNFGLQVHRIKVHPKGQKGEEDPTVESATLNATNKEKSFSEDEDYNEVAHDDMIIEDDESALEGTPVKAENVHVSHQLRQVCMDNENENKYKIEENEADIEFVPLHDPLLV